jgi:Na+/melibiose symporter-like transporter
MQLLSLVLLPETVHADTGRTGHAQAGAFTGLYTAAETGALALGPGVFALILAATSFHSSDLETPVVQPASAITGIGVGFTIVPALLLLISVPPLLAFRRAAARRPVEEAQENAV